MARKPNYGFEKRRKELDRKAKKDARLEERRLRGAQPAEGEAPPPDSEADAPEEGGGPPVD